MLSLETFALGDPDFFVLLKCLPAVAMKIEMDKSEPARDAWLKHGQAGKVKKFELQDTDNVLREGGILTKYRWTAGITV